MKLLWGGSEPASTVAGQQALYAGAPETGSGRGAPIAQGQSSNASIGPADDQVKTKQTSEIDAGAPLFSRNLPGGEEGLSNFAVRHLLPWRGKGLALKVLAETGGVNAAMFGTMAARYAD